MRRLCCLLYAVISLTAVAARAITPPSTTAPTLDAASAVDVEFVELKFRDFFVLPVGPKGLTPSKRLLDLSGRRVRISGYMVRQDKPVEGMFILSPLPVALADEDEGLSDDLPPSSIFVHLAASEDASTAPFVAGLLSVTGVLELGASPEADGRLSFVRLRLLRQLPDSVFALPR